MLSPSPVDHYAHLARFYDWIVEPVFRPLRLEIRDWVLSRSPERVLDICCGTGRQIRYFPEDAPIVGLDLSPDMLRQAARQVPGKCIRGDAIRLPFPEDTFDVVISELALHEKPLATRQQELAEIARVLRPEGRLLVLDYAVPDTDSWGARAVRWGLDQVERRAGDEHYRHYRTWMEEGGLSAILPRAGWRPVSEQRRFKRNLASILFERSP
ncbi:MAG: methyltransferase domain-containing protein [Candidatus Neomarinimicrobiota bacterium]|nr:MAG: methyltransferase domain-containing protein [Candidatus Neomarinimicrobiota bacterium]